MLQNRSVPDIRAKREAWKKHIPERGVNNLVFLDESGVNTNMTRRYARSKRNERAVDSAPVNTPCSTTILPSIRLKGKTVHTVYQGGTTAERFAELPGAIEKAFSTVRPSDCSGGVRSFIYLQ